MKDRILALDVGTVRVGVAISDPLGIFAQGLCVLQTKNEWIDELARLVDENRAGILLVGMPRRTDGTEGPEAGRMRKVVENLKERFPNLEIIVWDERFTTTIAQAALIEADVSRKKRKGRIDMVAATLLLQNYLEFIRKDVPHATT